MNETLETLNIAVYCTICHLRPLRNKYSFDIAYENFLRTFYTRKTHFFSIKMAFGYLEDWSNKILRALEKHLNIEHEFNYKLVEYTHYAIAWYNNSFDKSHGRTREYCLNESQRWANLAINEYQNK